MGAGEPTQETYLPEADGQQLVALYEFIRAHEAAGRGRTSRYRLVGPNHDEVDVPAEVYRALHKVIEAMSQGLAVTVVPQCRTMTTQQAAELLGVSRPRLIRLLETGRIPYERLGAHRRVLLADVLAYRQRRREEKYRVLEATSVDLDDEEDIDAVLASLREARRTVAARTRSR